VRVPTALKKHSVNGNGVGPDIEQVPMVLLHGFGSSRSLKPLIRALGADRPVYAPDLPGFGMSEQPVHPLDVPGLADALRHWMIDNGLAPAILVGCSFGCQVAVDLAARYPASVESLVLIAPTVDPKVRTPGELAKRWARNAHHASPRLATTVVHDFIDAGPWRSITTVNLALEDRMEPKLGEIEAPTLVVRPEKDHLVPDGWAERVAELIPDAEFVVLPKAGHSIGPKAAGALAELVKPYLAEEPVPS
jgi:pimeloyl-ACP methyl ester carboxylesterase